MPRMIPSACLAMLAAACVPEYRPGSDAGDDADLDAGECTPLPPGIGELAPVETETGYDHRAGLSSLDERGVIYHVAYRTRSAGSNTMLSFQDFRGEGPSRIDETVTIHRENVLADGTVEIVPIQDYTDCTVCVLYLEDCPFESLGGCGRQFLAVQGTVRFIDFEKADGSWSQDTLDVLDVELTDLEFKEVRIDPDTYATTVPAHVCPGERCTAQGVDPPEECFSIHRYRFCHPEGGDCG
jgi:hypothetical protein